MTAPRRRPSADGGRPLAGSLAAVVAALLFGMLGPLARLASEAGMPGISVTAWRALLGAGSIAVVLAATGGVPGALASLRSLSGRGRAALATAAGAGLVVNTATFTAFGLAPVAVVLMMFYTYPAGVTVVDVLLGQERLTRLRAAALALSMGGVALVLLGGRPSSGEAPGILAGAALGLAASAAQVVFFIVSRNGYRTVPAPAASAVIMAAAVVGASLLAVVSGQAAGLLVPLSAPAVWPLILLAGVAAAGVSSSLSLMAIRRIGATRAGILMLFEPVTGVILAALVLGEALAALQAVGAGLVLAGAVVLQLGAEPGREAVVEAAGGPLV